LIANSPILSWVYSVGSLRGVSNGIGVIEVALALLIAARRFSPRIRRELRGSRNVCDHPDLPVQHAGNVVSGPGFPIPVTSAGGAFVIKDVFLLGAAMWSAAESWTFRISIKSR